MLIPNHPHDEQLSALASGDPDVTADATLSAHVAECLRCTETVNELRLLSHALAELPDLRPHRPLRLLPEVADAPSRVDRLGGWARRFFAPALTAGAALAMVGLVGTTAPILSGFGPQAGGAAPQELEQAPGAEGAAGGADSGAPEEPASAAGGEAAGPTADSFSGAGDGSTRELHASEEPTEQGTDDVAAPADLSAERSPWPMVLFTGVAVMIAAALLRWILAPRAP